MFLLHSSKFTCIGGKGRAYDSDARQNQLACWGGGAPRPSTSASCNLQEIKKSSAIPKESLAILVKFGNHNGVEGNLLEITRKSMEIFKKSLKKERGDM